jgi:hypothetical protein
MHYSHLFRFYCDVPKLACSPRRPFFPHDFDDPPSSTPHDQDPWTTSPPALLPPPSPLQVRHTEFSAQTTTHEIRCRLPLVPSSVVSTYPYSLKFLRKGAKTCGRISSHIRGTESPSSRDRVLLTQRPLRLQPPTRATAARA